MIDLTVDARTLEKNIRFCKEKMSADSRPKRASGGYFFPSSGGRRYSLTESLTADLCYLAPVFSRVGAEYHCRSEDKG